MAKEKDLVEKYGEQAFISAEDFLNNKRKVISISPKLDLILGGGIPEGSFVIIAGDEKVGKTVTSLHFAGNAQKDGRKVFYYNIEGRIKTRDIQGIKSLDPSKMEIIRSYMDETTGESRILKAHEYLEIVERKMKENPGSVHIIDSASQLLTQEEDLGGMDDKQRAPGAVLLSKFCKKIANVLPVNNNIIIMIVHLIANTGGGYKKKSRSGGRKINYAVDVDLECLYTKPWKIGGSEDDDDSGTVIGKKVYWKTLSTGTSAPPFMTTESWLKFGVGIDEDYEAIELGKSLGLIEKGGAWFTLAYMRDFPEMVGLDPKDKKFESSIKAQGSENLSSLLDSHPDWLAKLKEKVKETIG